MKLHFDCRRKTNGLVAASLFVILAGSSQAQSSASYELSEANLNFGGRPGTATGPGMSASYELSLDALGGGPNGSGSSSASYALHAGFVAPLGPPGNASDFYWTSHTDMHWSAGSSATSYNVYRDGLATLPALGYGQCLGNDRSGLTHTDPDSPAVGSAFFYLVSAKNRLGEESSKGRDSGGTSRRGNACP